MTVVSNSILHICLFLGSPLRLPTVIDMVVVDTRFSTSTSSRNMKVNITFGALVEHHSSLTASQQLH
jgi:hypothetical protein